MIPSVVFTVCGDLSNGKSTSVTPLLHFFYVDRKHYDLFRTFHYVFAAITSFYFNGKASTNIKY